MFNQSESVDSASAEQGNQTDFLYASVEKQIMAC